MLLCFNCSLMQTYAQDRPGNYGLLKPQDAATLPKSKAPMQKGVLKTKRVPHTTLQKNS